MIDQQKVIDIYKRLRTWAGVDMTAEKAFPIARLAVMNGKHAFEIKTLRNAHWNKPFEKDGETYRWIEDGKRALRFVGYCDELNDFVKHTGWFTRTEDDFEEKYRGVVFQAPARNRSRVYFVGFECPNNPGHYCLSSTPSYSDEKAVDGHRDPEIGSIAARADRIAEDFANDEREYREGIQACEDAFASARRFAREYKKLRGLGLPDQMDMARDIYRQHQAEAVDMLKRATKRYGITYGCLDREDY
jgi:hypothetical protein